MTETELTKQGIGALKLYPQTEIADEDIQNTIQSLWASNKKFMIISGPPGVGKTRACEDCIIQIIRTLDAPHGIENCRISELFPNFKTKVYSNEEIRAKLSDSDIEFVWDICVLHPQYSYEDLILGYRLKNSDNSSPTLEVREGLLGFTSRVVGILESFKDISDHPRGCIVLDEINRAPIGQLFGEGLYSLDRRGVSVSTPYHLEGVGSQLVIPEGLLILGTMNSIDRAVSGFDFALKRRFVTVTLSPNEKPIVSVFKDLPQAKEIALNLFRQARDLVNGASQSGIVPTSELIVGHSYFLPPDTIKNDANAIKWLAESYKFQILPILLDYQEEGLLKYLDDAVQKMPCSNVILGKQCIGEITVQEIVSYLTA